MNLEEIKKRLEHDENRWMKIQQSQNTHRNEVYNQLADLFGLVRQQQAKINKLEQIVKELRNAIPGQ